MIEMYQDHCQVVVDSLSGTRAADEQTLGSLAVLSERLERVKKLGGRFSFVRFSHAVEQLKTRSTSVPVG